MMFYQHHHADVDVIIIIAIRWWSQSQPRKKRRNPDSEKNISNENEICKRESSAEIETTFKIACSSVSFTAALSARAN